MAQIFSQVLDMSLVGSLVILAVLAARLCLRRAPRWISCGLWLAVLLRLLCPWSPELSFSAVPAELPTVSQSAGAVSDLEPLYVAEAAVETVTDALRGQPLQKIMADVGPDLSPTRLPAKEVLLLAAAWLWPLGMLILVLYCLISLLRLRLRLLPTVSRDGNVYEVHGLPTPFVLGLLRPKIYLPSGLSAEERPYILLHEQTHIRRGDHVWKLLGFLALTVHWFNPLVWLAFSLASKDMEIACDEAVMKKLGPEIRADYSASLLRLATGRSFLAGAPLGFGEGNPKRRIKHILRYKKPALWFAVLSVMVVLVLTVALVANPVSENDLFGTRYLVNETLYHGNVTYSFTYTPENAPSFIVTESGELYSDEGGQWTFHGTLTERDLSVKERNALFPGSSNQVQEVMDSIITVYEATGVEQDLYYYLFEYKPIHWRNSRLYLAMGHREDEMRWLFRLETITSGVDLEYLDFAISHRTETADPASCFAVYEDDGMLLAGFTAEQEIGIMKFSISDANRRRTYDMLSGIMNQTSGAVVQTFYEDFVTYPAYATMDPAQKEYNALVGETYYSLNALFFPALVVERIPYTLEDYWSYFNHNYFTKAETPTNEATVEHPVVDAASEVLSGPVYPTSPRPVYDLTQNAPAALSAEKLAEHSFWTNSCEITVTGEQIFGETTVYLCDAETGNQLMQKTLISGNAVTFHNLTSAQTYTLETDGGPNTLLTVTD